MRYMADVGTKGPFPQTREIIMATTTHNNDFDVYDDVELSPLPVYFALALGLWFIYRVVLKFSSRFAERRAALIIGVYDGCADNLVESVEQERKGAGVAPGDDVSGGPVAYVRPRPARLQKMAAALAHEAYFQFGFRPRSDANLLITRKFMRDRLTTFRDLRAKDAATIVDMALYLSFLPSQALREMNIIDGTDVFGSRSEDVPDGFGWFGGFVTPTRGRWWPFGRQRQRA